MQMPADPPWLEHFFAEQPLPVVFVLVIAGLVVLFVKRGEVTRRTIALGGGLILLAVGIYIFARVYETDRESLQAAAHAMAADVSQGDGERIADWFADDAYIFTGDRTRPLRIKPAVKTIADLTRQYGLGEHDIIDAAAETPSQSNGNLYLKVRTHASVHGMSHTTDWLINWRRDAKKKWKIVELQWLKVDGREPPTSLIP